MYNINEMASIHEAWKKNPDRVIALVTLVDKEGSSYRQPGARMLVMSDGETVGTISGGCLEGDLAQLALRMRKQGISSAIETVDTRPVFGCHGTISLFIEIVYFQGERFTSTMEQLGAAIAKRTPIVLITKHGTNEENLGTTAHTFKHNELPSTKKHVFVQPFGRRKRVVVIGAHGDVKPVLNQATCLGWEAAQVIPGQQRNGWICSDANIQTEGLSSEQVIEAFPPDSSTAIILMTHNLGRDVQYANSLLNESYGYIGMLGSIKRRNEVIDHLISTGKENIPDAIDRLHCPIGLDIGSETQEEIALSIISEIQAVFSKRSGSSLKNKSISIHPEVEIS